MICPSEDLRSNASPGYLNYRGKMIVDEVSSLDTSDGEYRNTAVLLYAVVHV